jgi:hypothetical protein
MKPDRHSGSWAALHGPVIGERVVVAGSFTYTRTSR